VTSETKRIFFALWPSDQQRQKVEAALAPYRDRLKGKWVARANWHVTLVFIGGFPEPDIKALQDATAAIACRPFDLKLERIDYWKRPKIMCLSTDFVANELSKLVRDLGKAATRFGFVPEKRPLKPHMTIARKARFFEPITLAQPLELHWSGFRLVESVSTPDGVEYRPLDQ
jgi:2'-5' RNA ligase